MQTKAQVVSTLKANLGDLRCHGICLFIDEMLERKNAKTGISRWRVKNKVTGLELKTVAEVIAAITDAHITMRYPFGAVVMQTDRVTGYNVRVTNVEIVFNQKAQDDFINGEFLGAGAPDGAAFNLQFNLAYLNDADSDVPVKITSVRLVS